MERYFRCYPKPTAQKNIEERIGKTDIEWEAVYSKIYSSTLDVKLRAFQYKLVNNCLYLNEKLYLFKKTETPKCSFCLDHDESITHFFVECTKTKKFYLECQNWLKEANTILPKLSLENVLLGLEGNAFQYFMLTLWKYTLYNARKSGRPHLSAFSSNVALYEKIEYSIAKSRGKIKLHLEKYENIRNLLNSTTEKV